MTRQNVLVIARRMPALALLAGLLLVQLGRERAVRADALPGGAVLLAPSGVGVTVTPTYTWNAVAEVTDYYLWVNDAGGTAVVQTWYPAASVCADAMCAVTLPAAATPSLTTARGRS
jgi:hypothetical protein